MNDQSPGREPLEPSSMVEYALIAVSIALLTVGQLLQKRAVSLAGKPSRWTRYLATVATMRQTWWGYRMCRPRQRDMAWCPPSRGCWQGVSAAQSRRRCSGGAVPADPARTGPPHAVARGGDDRCRRGSALLDMKSGRQLWVGPVAVTGSIVLSACAQLSMKAGMLHATHLESAPDLIDAAAFVPVPILLIAGFGCYGRFAGLLADRPFAIPAQPRLPSAQPELRAGLPRGRRMASSRRASERSAHRRDCDDCDWCSAGCEIDFDYT